MLRRSIVTTLERSGVFEFLTRRLHRRSLLVLAYHSILEQELPQPFRYHHTAREFAAQLEWLGRNCEPVGLDGVRKWIAGQWRPAKPPVLITFDDGYRNNSTIAAGLLKQKGMPAVFFLSTDYIGRDRVLWPDILFARIAGWTAGSLRLPEGGEVEVPAPGDARIPLAFRVLQSAKDSPEEKRLAYLDYLASQTPEVNVKPWPQAQDFMSWDEARAMARLGFDLGSHTVTHPILSRIDPQQLHRELSESRGKVEAETGSRCIAIAYPNGTSRDYNSAVLAATREAGYEFGFTVSERWCDPPADPLAIDRIPPPGHTSLSTFAFHASGAMRLLRK